MNNKFIFNINDILPFTCVLCVLCGEELRENGMDIMFGLFMLKMKITRTCTVRVRLNLLNRSKHND